MKKISEGNDIKMTLARMRVVIELIVKNILLLPVRFITFIVNSVTEIFRFSLTYRIGLIYTLLTMIVLVTFNFGFVSGFRYLWQKNQIDQLVQLKKVYVQSFQDQNSIELSTIKNYIEADRLSINIYDKSNAVIATTNRDLPPLFFNVKEGNTIKVKDGSNRYLISSYPLLYQAEQYYLQVVKDVSSDEQFMNKLAYISVVLTIITLFFMMYLGSKVSVQVLNPIKEMTNQIKQITIKRLDFRLDTTTAQNELKDLTLQFNALFDKIEDAYSRQNQFVSDASHELRTPLSVINGYVSMLERWGKKDESVLDESIEAIKDETILMKELIEKLLFLARSDRNKIEMDIAELALHDLVTEICRETKMIDTVHTINCQVEGESFIYGNEKMIKQMMRIFIDNAIKFTDSPGEITIGMRCVADKTVLIVRDSGIGIAKEDLPKIFDRFYRTDKSRAKKSGGSGLGLSIAKWIIDQHQATVRIYSELGIGTKIEIWFNKKMQIISD